MVRGLIAAKVGVVDVKFSKNVQISQTVSGMGCGEGRRLSPFHCLAP